jgi:hypothetical protein
MTSDDFEALAPDGGALAIVDDQARAAADAVRRARVGAPPPPLGGRPMGAVGRLRVMALALVLIATVGAAIAFGTAASRRTTPAHPPRSQTPTDKVAHELAAGKFAAIPDGMSGYEQLHVDALGVKAEWERLTTAFGPYRSVGPPTVGGSQFSATLTMSRGKVELAVVVGVNGTVTNVDFGPVIGPHPPVLDIAYVAPRALAEIHALVDGDATAFGEHVERPFLQPAGSWMLSLWQQVTRAYGPVQSIGSPALVPTVPPLFPAVVNVPVHMQRGEVTVQVGFDENGLIGSVEPVLPGSPSFALAGTMLGAAADDAVALARSVVTALGGRNFDVVTSHFDQVAAANLTAQSLRQEWDALTGRLGVLRATDGPAIMCFTPGLTCLESGLTFDHGSAHLQVAFDPGDQIEQLTILPGPPTRNLGQ